MKAFKSEIKNKCVLRRLNRTEVTHELSGRLCYKRSAHSETLGINNAVVAVVGSAKSGELIGMSHPVKLTRINNAAADSRTVTVHIFCC